MTVATFNTSDHGNDTELIDITPDINYNSGPTIRCGFISGKSSPILRILLSIDMAFSGIDLTGDAVITAAVLTLKAESGTLALSKSFEAKRNTRTLYSSGGVTWNKYLADLTWTTPGGDFTVTDQASVNLSTPVDLVYPDVIALVQDAITNRGNQFSIFIIGDSEGDSGQITFHSGQAASSLNWPKLEVTYHIEAVREEGHTLELTDGCTVELVRPVQAVFALIPRIIFLRNKRRWIITFPEGHTL